MLLMWSQEQQYCFKTKQNKMLTFSQEQQYYWTHNNLAILVPIIAIILYKYKCCTVGHKNSNNTVQIYTLPFGLKNSNITVQIETFLLSSKEQQYCCANINIDNLLQRTRILLYKILSRYKHKCCSSGLRIAILLYKYICSAYGPRNSNITVQI